MGYRSDVVIAFAFKKKEQIDEVMAIYRMHPFVQAHALEEHWKIHDWDGCWGLTFHAEDVKWYPTYDDVQGFEHMLSVVKDFAEQRGQDVSPINDDGEQDIISAFPYAYRKLRIGEEDGDIEREADGNDHLIDDLYERITLVRHFETNF
jgi:hypothetical protein